MLMHRALMNCSAHCAPATFLSSLNTRIHSIDFNIFAIYSSLLLVSLLFSLEIFSHSSINSNESSIFSFLQFEKNPIFPKLICEQSVDLKKKKGKKERSTRSKSILWIETLDQQFNRIPGGRHHRLSVRVIVLDCSSDIYGASPEGHV